MASDVLNRPICCVPKTEITIQERDRDENGRLKYTGNKQQAINMGSYNYLGFSQTNGSCSGIIIHTT